MWLLPERSVRADAARLHCGLIRGVLSYSKCAIAWSRTAIAVKAKGTVSDRARLTMEKGLLWLPLLGLFIWLAWAGWNEFQKVEAYRQWAEPFDRAKYDIYSVLGQKGSEITWGKPSRPEPTQLSTFSLQEIVVIRLLVNDRVADWDSLPAKGNPVLEFQPHGDRPPIRIPFTDISLAAKWGRVLEEIRQAPADAARSSE